MSESLFACVGCGYQAPVSWAPRPCPNPHCRRFYNIRAARVVTDRGPAVEDGERVSLRDVADNVEDVERIVLGGDLAGIDHVLGGGLVPGSVALLSGAPGLGKSTLTLQILARVAQSVPTLYVSGEESVQAVASRAKRLGGDLHERLEIVKAVDLDEIKDQIDDAGAKVAAIDSLQMISCYSPTTGDELEPGGAMSVGVSVAALVEHAQQEDLAIILIGRVTRDNTVAGPRGGLDHQVDAVLEIAGNPKRTARVVTAEKNRFGATAKASAHFDMTECGLVPRAEKKAKAGA